MRQRPIDSDCCGIGRPSTILARSICAIRRELQYPQRNPVFHDISCDRHSSVAGRIVHQVPRYSIAILMRAEMRPIVDLMGQSGIDLALVTQWAEELGSTPDDIVLDLHWVFNDKLWQTPSTIMVRLCHFYNQVNCHKVAAVRKRVNEMRLWIEDDGRLQEIGKPELIEMTTNILQLGSDNPLITGLPYIAEDVMVNFLLSVLIPDRQLERITARAMAVSSVKSANGSADQAQLKLTSNKSRSACMLCGIDDICRKIEQAWEKTSSDIYKVRDLGVVIEREFPSPRSRSFNNLEDYTFLKVKNLEPKDKSILRRIWVVCSTMERWQHPSIFYWISELKRIYEDLEKFLIRESGWKVPEIATILLIIHSQIHTLRVMGLIPAIAAREEQHPKVTNDILCYLLNPNLPPLQAN